MWFWLCKTRTVENELLIKLVTFHALHTMETDPLTSEFKDSQMCVHVCVCEVSGHVCVHISVCNLIYLLVIATWPQHNGLLYDNPKEILVTSKATVSETKSFMEPALVWVWSAQYLWQIW